MLSTHLHLRDPQLMSKKIFIRLRFDFNQSNFQHQGGELTRNHACRNQLMRDITYGQWPTLLD